MAGTAASDAEDLVVHETGRHGDPLNAETKLDTLASHYITPVADLFHRNHDDIVYQPKVPAVYTDWVVSLRVDEDVAREQGWQRWEQSDARMLPVSDLVHCEKTCKGLEHLDATATIECAGNRRGDLDEDERAEGIQWGAGVIANVFWTGPSLRSLLLLHGVSDPYAHHADLSSLTPSDSNISNDCAPWAQSLHLHLLSAQPSSASEHPEGEFFGASIPLSTALHPNQRCILAYRHNGKALEQAHGFPLRAVIPGHAGARWVKWLRGLRISKHENDSHAMQLDYKMLIPPTNDKGGSEADEWKAKMMGDEKDDAFRKSELAKQPAMQRLGMGSAIESPHHDAVVKARSVTARGYAVGQDGSPVSSIECIVVAQDSSSDDSSMLRLRAQDVPASQWTQADVQTGSNASDESVSWAWTLWEAVVPLPTLGEAGEATRYALIARATTASGVQQERESAWNVRGFQTRSWPVIRNLRVERQEL